MVFDAGVLVLLSSFLLGRQPHSPVASRKLSLVVVLCWLLLVREPLHPFPIAIYPKRRRENRGSVLVHSYAIIPPAYYRNGPKCRWIQLLSVMDQRRRTKSLYSSYGDSVSNALVNFDNEDAAAEDYQTRFRGVAQLYSRFDDDQRNTTVGDRLQNSVVVVVGLGGVGSWAAEALGRSGVGTLILIDMDDICRSNVNRQLHALSNTIGAMKIDVMSQRLREINPFCNVYRIYDFVTAENVYEVFDSIPKQNVGNPTAVLDCMDQARDKAALMAYCDDRGLPIVTVGSTAGRSNPMKITARDITSVYQTLGHGGDRLLTTVRKELRQKYNFTKGQPFGQASQSWHIDCVYSEEEVLANPTSSDSFFIDGNGISTSSHAKSSFRKCDNGVLGTASFVTGTFGFIAASVVVQGVALNQLRPPCGTGRATR
jgi:tRNA threonylcarbamoyladenosine dehydratase